MHPRTGVTPLYPSTGPSRRYNGGMKILVIEDEKKTANYLCRGLVEHGFAVEATGRGEEGLLLARSGAFDLILLDVMLPGRDGWSIITELRRGGNLTPVLFVTARDAVEERVKGLELGADDYLVKPFAFTELLARVRSLLRRGAGRQPDVVRIADLELDLVRQRAAGRRQATRADAQGVCPSVLAGPPNG